VNLRRQQETASTCPFGRTNGRGQSTDEAALLAAVRHTSPWPACSGHRRIRHISFPVEVRTCPSVSCIHEVQRSTSMTRRPPRWRYNKCIINVNEQEDKLRKSETTYTNATCRPLISHTAVCKLEFKTFYQIVYDKLHTHCKFVTECQLQTGSIKSSY